MSAIRYSGELRIRVTHVDGPSNGGNGEYRCFIRCARVGGGDSFGPAFVVGAPAVLSHAVDSPETFDRAAHAALSFAEACDWPVEAHAATNGTGWHIGRSLQTAWPQEKV